MALRFLDEPPKFDWRSPPQALRLSDGTWAIKADVAGVYGWIGGLASENDARFLLGLLERVDEAARPDPWDERD